MCLTDMLRMCRDMLTLSTENAGLNPYVSCVLNCVMCSVFLNLGLKYRNEYAFVFLCNLEARKQCSLIDSVECSQQMSTSRLQNM